MQRHPSDTENKLLLLYAVDCLGPVTAQQLLLFLVEMDEMGYIAIQLGLAELSEAQLLRKEKHPVGVLYTLTGKGRDSLDMFGGRVPHSRRTSISARADAFRQRFRRERQMPATFERVREGEYRVRLRLLEKDATLLDIAVSVPTHKQAEKFCGAWIGEAAGIYAQLVHSLGEGEQEEEPLSGC